MFLSNATLQDPPANTIASQYVLEEVNNAWQEDFLEEQMLLGCMCKSSSPVLTQETSSSKGPCSSRAHKLRQRALTGPVW